MEQEDLVKKVKRIKVFGRQKSNELEDKMSGILLHIILTSREI